MDLFGKKAQAENAKLREQIEALNRKLQELGYDDYKQVKEALEAGNKQINEQNTIIATQRQTIQALTAEMDKLARQNKTASNKLTRSRELYKSMMNK